MPKRDAAPRRDPHGTAGRQPRKIGPGDRHERIVLEAEFGSEQRALEGGRPFGIADEHVRQPQCRRIDGARQRHALGPMPGPSEVLDGGPQPWRHDGDESGSFIHLPRPRCRRGE
jgi:hypothetical protein